MIALLVWLAGCILGCWLIWHEGYGREAIAFCVCASVLMWMVGGASWIGRKLSVGAAARTPRVNGMGAGSPVPLTESDREALKRAANAQTER